MVMPVFNNSNLRRVVLNEKSVPFYSLSTSTSALHKIEISGILLIVMLTYGYVILSDLYLKTFTL